MILWSALAARDSALGLVLGADTEMAQAARVEVGARLEEEHVHLVVRHLVDDEVGEGIVLREIQ